MALTLGPGLLAFLQTVVSGRRQHAYGRLVALQQGLDHVSQGLQDTADASAASRS